MKNKKSKKQTNIKHENILHENMFWWIFNLHRIRCDSIGSMNDPEQAPQRPNEILTEYKYQDMQICSSQDTGRRRKTRGAASST